MKWLVDFINQIKGKIYLSSFRRKHRVSDVYDIHEKGYLKGRDRSKKYIVFRVTTDEGLGLMSVAREIIPWIDWSETMNLIPVVLWDKKDCFFDNPFGLQNRWDTCFTQSVSRDGLISLSGKYDIYVERLHNGCSNYVFLNETKGKRFCRISEITKISMMTYTKCGEIIGDICRRHLCPSLWVEELIQKETDRLKIDYSKTLAVILREEFAIEEANLSEDWKWVLMLHPHAYSIEDAAVKVKETMKKLNLNKIFLSTIVQDSIGYISQMLGKDSVLFIDRNRDSLQETVDNVNQGTWKEEKDRDISYCAEIIMASRCRALVAHISSGSRMAIAMNGGRYDDIVLMDYGDRGGSRY